MTDDKRTDEFRRILLEWFRRNRRELPWRGLRDPYPIWVSEVMLQQTQVKTVVPYFERFVEKYPDILTLAKAEVGEVLKSWEKLGYYARARNLHRAAKRIVEELGGEVPRDYALFRELPGVGDYIGAAVMSIAFDQPHAVVDGNVKRLVSRLFLIPAPVNKPSSTRVYRNRAQSLLDTRHPGLFNQAMMELGATICRPARPECERCPVADFCEARRSGRQDAFPIREKRRAVPKYHIAIGVIQKNERILITQRKSSGLLGGLWEFPGGKVRPGESPENACKREIKEEVNISVDVVDYLAHVDHAYSHFKIAVDVYTCTYRAGSVQLRGPVDHRWILVDEIDKYAFPGANHKFIPLLKQRLMPR